MIFLSPPVQIPGYCHKLGHDHSHQHPFQFITHLSHFYSTLNLELMRKRS
jgi:hypothetical protein